MDPLYTHLLLLLLVWVRCLTICSRRHIRQHTSEYVNFRQHTSEYVSILQHRSTYVSIRQHMSAYVSICQHTSAYVSIRQFTSEHVSIRQYTSVYVRMRLRLPDRGVSQSAGDTTAHTVGDANSRCAALSEPTPLVNLRASVGPVFEGPAFDAQHRRSLSQ
jgi:hypothetical protein